MSPTPLRPQHLGNDAWLITELFPGMPGCEVPISSAVIAGREPIVIDTGTSLNRHAWTEAVHSIVEPDDVRWIYLSHDDHDHTGNLVELLGTCKNATLITNWFTCERLVGDLPLPRNRMRWINDGESIDVGDRTIHSIRPPVYDSPTTRGLFDPRSGLYWAADCFASMTTGAMLDADDLDDELWEGTFIEMNRQVSPWLSLVDPVKFSAVVDGLRRLDARTVVGAHGAHLSGGRIVRAYDLLEQLTTHPEVQFPGQMDLEAMLAQTVGAA